MKIVIRVLLVVLPLVAAVSAAEKKTPAPPSAKAGDAAQRHPLKGVVTAVDADQSALRVKHEDVPGVMRAMTMQFKVDAATLKSVKPGDAITAMLMQEGSEYWLRDVKVVSAKKS